MNVTELVATLKDMGDKVRWPKEMKSDPSERSQEFWCEFHSDQSHKTLGCTFLRGKVDLLLKEAYLTELFSDKAKLSYMKNWNKEEPPKVLTPKEDSQRYLRRKEINEFTFTIAKKFKKCLFLMRSALDKC